MSLKQKVISLFFITLLAISVSGFADSTLDVNVDAAMEGTFGMETTADGTPTNAFVRDFSPNEEAVFRASFLFDPNNMNIAFGGRHLIFAAAANSVNGSRSIEVQIRRNPSNTFDVRCIAMVTGATAHRNYCGVIPVAFSGPHLFTLEWEASQTPGVPGFVQLTVDGVTEGRPVLNFSQRIRASNMGLLGGSIDPGTVGSHYFDDFQSFRTLAP